MKRVLTVCPYCGCGCGLYLTVNKDRVIGSYPSANHPVSRGSLCVKGWNCYEFIHHPQRLTQPLVKQAGRFLQVSWDKALNLIARRLKDTQKNFGPDALGFLSSAKATNEENYLMMKLARAVFKTNNIDHCARLCHAPTVVGLNATFGSGAMTNSIEDFENVQVFLVTGSDTTNQHPLLGSRIINAIKEKGAKLIVVDPRKIELAKYATIYAQQRNGTDVAWINAVINVIISERLHNEKFIKERTENFEQLKEVVKEYTPEYAERITSIPKEKIIEIARLYARASSAVIVYSMGITQHITGVDNVKSLANLAMVTGNVGFPLSGVSPLRGQNNVQGACDMGALPDVLSGYQKVTDEKVRQKFADAWEVKDLSVSAGLTNTEIINAAEEDKIKALYIMGENPLLSDPASNRVREALEKVKFLVVQDIFLSDTAEYADVVLPSATFAEKDGTFTNTERRVQRIRKVTSPPGKAEADWKILCEMAKRCGYKRMDYSSPSEIMDEIAKLTPIYGGISYERLEPYGLQWPCPTREHPGTPFLHKDKFSKGKGSFIPCHYIPPAELPDEEYNFTLSTGRIYWHWHTRTMTKRTSTLEREAPHPYVEINSEDARNLNVKSEDLVKVSSRRGSIQIRVRETPDIAKGSVFIPFHFKEAQANILTNPALDPIAKIPEYKVCAVKLEKICSRLK